MDVNACLDQLIQAVLDDEFETARERLQDLRFWRRGGGFAPRDPRIAGA